MAQAECYFCHEEVLGINSFAESDLFRARWDNIPALPGHAEIVPKRHVQYFEELSEDEMTSMLLFARDVMETIRRADLVAVYTDLLVGANESIRPYLLKALDEAKMLDRPSTAFTHGVNDGTEAGQTIPHLHYHLIPRRDGDVADARGGIRRIFPEDSYSMGEIK